MNSEIFRIFVNIQINYNFNAMRYLIRAIKYFIYFSLMCAVIVTVLVLIGAVEGGVDNIFDEGYRSIGKIAIFFAIVSAAYPKFGFICREMNFNGTWDGIRNRTVEFMSERQYSLESENAEKVTFRYRGMAGRLSKMLEDRVTLTKTEEGWQMEGLRKDVLRLASGLENRLTPQDAE